MKRAFLLFLSAFACGFVATAQDAESTTGETPDEAAKWTHNVAFTGAFGLQEGIRVSSLEYTYLHGFGESKNLRVGPGLRGYVYTGEFINHAPAGSDAVFSTDDFSDQDRLLVLDPSFSGLNLTLNVQYQTDKFAAGASFDLAGLGFGGTSGGRFYPADTSNGEAILESVNIAEGRTSAPTLNTVVGGSRTNEIWVGYRVRPAIMLRAGVNAYFSDVVIDDEYLPAGVEEATYKHMSLLGLVGIRLQIN